MSIMPLTPGSQFVKLLICAKMARRIGPPTSWPVFHTEYNEWPPGGQIVKLALSAYHTTQIDLGKPSKKKKRLNLGIVPNRVGGWSPQSQFLNRF